MQNLFKPILVILGYLTSGLLVLYVDTNSEVLKPDLVDFILTITYSILGTCLLFTIYKFIDWLIPIDIEQEIFEKQNLAAAVFKGMILLGVSLLIAAVILAP